MSSSVRAGRPFGGGALPKPVKSSTTSRSGAGASASIISAMASRNSSTCASVASARSSRRTSKPGTPFHHCSLPLQWRPKAASCWPRPRTSTFSSAARLPRAFLPGSSPSAALYSIARRPVPSRRRTAGHGPRINSAISWAASARASSSMSMSTMRSPWAAMPTLSSSTTTSSGCTSGAMVCRRRRSAGPPPASSVARGACPTWGRPGGRSPAAPAGSPLPPAAARAAPPLQRGGGRSSTPGCRRSGGGRLLVDLLVEH